jgi:hypothetical protein
MSIIILKVYFTSAVAEKFVEILADVRRNLEEPFASEAIEWSETDTQIDKFLRGVLCPHHPALFVLVSVVKKVMD